MNVSSRNRVTCLALSLAAFSAGIIFPHPGRCADAPALNGKTTNAISTAPRAKTPTKQLTASALMRLAAEPIEDNPKLPRILLLGDSITMGYTVLLRESLQDKANVHFPTENCHNFAANPGAARRLPRR